MITCRGGLQNGHWLKPSIHLYRIFGRTRLKKQVWQNWLFVVLGTWFLLFEMPVKIKFEVDKNQIWQTWFFKLDFQKSSADLKEEKAVLHSVAELQIYFWNILNICDVLQKKSNLTCSPSEAKIELNFLNWGDLIWLFTATYVSACHLSQWSWKWGLLNIFFLFFPLHQQKLIIYHLSWPNLCAFI